MPRPFCGARHAVSVYPSFPARDSHLYSERRKSIPCFSLLVSVFLLPVLWSTSALRAGDLADRIDLLIAASEFRDAHWGVLIVDRDSGRTLYELNADKLFAPASVTKLFSVAAALEAFGADFRFKTPVHRRGEVAADGVLDGDLILVASGDLTLGGRTTGEDGIAYTDHDHTYANGSPRATLTSPNPCAGLDELARQVAKAGIKHVRRGVRIDDRLFTTARGTGSGPRQISPILVNDNLLDLTIAATQPGQPAQISCRPQTMAWQLDSTIETVAAGEKLITWIRGDVSDNGTGCVTLTGQIPADHKPVVRVFEVPEPVDFARILFTEALERAGVTVDQPAELSPLPEREAYDKLPKVALLVSPPLSENIKLILKSSHNLHASTLPLLLASQQGERTLEQGLRRQGKILKSLGVDAKTISFGSGAGGSTADWVTPRATVALLRHMATRDDFASYKNALPVLGQDGTLATAVGQNSPARGKVFAKTGTYFRNDVMNNRTLLDSKALAGYMTTADGRELVFAAFLNRVPLGEQRSIDAAGELLGRLCEVIVVSRH